MESLEYKGNKYFVEKIDSWHAGKDEYRISVEEINSGEVFLPESYAGGKITEWFDRKSGNNSRYNKEKEFLSLLKRDFISDNSLQKLLKYSNELGETVCSAYITDFLRKKNGKRKDGTGFRL